MVHEAFVAVVEEGTEAAAATGVMMPTAAKPQEPLEMTLDRPSAFLIRDARRGPRCL